jgi:hypothetical protein
VRPQEGDSLRSFHLEKVYQEGDRGSRLAICMKKFRVLLVAAVLGTLPVVTAWAFGGHMGGGVGGHAGMGPGAGFGHQFGTPGRFAFRQGNRFHGRAFVRNGHFFPNNRFFVNRRFFPNNRFFRSNAVFVGFGFPVGFGIPYPYYPYPYYPYYPYPYYPY